MYEFEKAQNRQNLENSVYQDFIGPDDLNFSKYILAVRYGRQQQFDRQQSLLLMLDKTEIEKYYSTELAEPHVHSTGEVHIDACPHAKYGHITSKTIRHWLFFHVLPPLKVKLNLNEGYALVKFKSKSDMLNAYKILIEMTTGAGKGKNSGYGFITVCRSLLNRITGGLV